MTCPRLLFVSGKGGVGKTTVAAALARQAARDGRRVLLVQPTPEGRLPLLFGRRRLGGTPAPLAPRIDAVGIDPAALVDAYFRRLLRLPFLSRRLLSSRTFQAITTAAPGVVEFLTHDALLHWLEARGLRRRTGYDLILVDGPATGHAIRLLRSPRQLLSMISSGPLGGRARAAAETLTDRKRTRVILVSIPGEMAVNETVEARRILANDLGVALTRPVLNRVFPPRFSRTEASSVAQLATTCRNHPLVTAALLQIHARREAEQHLRRLRRAFGRAPLTVLQNCSGKAATPDLDRIGRSLEGLLS